jgi:hypothetical protein
MKCDVMCRIRDDKDTIRMQSPLLDGMMGSPGEVYSGLSR